MPPDPSTLIPEPTAYDVASHLPDGDSYFPRWRAAAAAFREARGDLGRLGLRYGTHPREGWDLFLPDTAPRGLMVFVHGGFWRLSGREDWSHLAAGAVGRGWAAALPSYPLCPEVRIGTITATVARALTSIAGTVTDLPIALAGHSAGGHLVLRMTCPDVALPEAVRRRIDRILAISPLGDLEPLRHLPHNADWRLDAGEAAAESPRRCPEPALPVTLAVGADERPAFVDQARWMAAAWPSARLEILPGRHHFDVIAPLEDPASPMTAALCP